ncbi:flippase-like domain-containing protein [Verrucomicrobiaceae bacterium N1E253]|uniref:Flippase-like domain-containing protein n=1 Tax=Oceaniferula marina TaxID=2748318 RepID=A0A851GFE8_9BACT|nr:lysylphosphatidylglycerol synthase transmembrane domain-containing protein [Oceaniferula marina]NWK56253.1 flippase-like domain-containing protein [Oceaniferula marina]
MKKDRYNNQWTGARLAVWGSTVVGVLILVVLVWRLDWSLLVNELGRIRWAFVPGLIGMTLLTFWFRAIRWRHLLPKGERFSRTCLLEASLVGFAANFVMPLRVGELVRPWVMSRWQAIRFSSALASIVVERVFDVIALMVLFGFCVGRLPSVPDWVVFGVRVMGLGGVGLLLFVLVVYVQGARMIRVGERCLERFLGHRFPRFVAKLVDLMEEFVTGLKGISSLKDLAWAVLWSTALWGSLVMLYQFGLWSFGVDDSWWVGASVCVMIALAVAAPGAPGFIGTFQLGTVVALALFGYSEEFGMAYSLVLHALQVITVVLAGVFVLHRRTMSWSDIRQRSGGA